MLSSAEDYRGRKRLQEWFLIRSETRLFDIGYSFIICAGLTPAASHGF